MLGRDTTTILGVKIDVLDMGGALLRARNLLQNGRAFFIVTPNPEIVLLAGRDTLFRSVLNSAALSLCDGTGLWLAGKLTGRPFPQRICGVDFMLDLCALAEEEGYPIGLIGSRREVRERLAKFLIGRFPKIIIETSAGEEGEAVAGGITFVALGAPRQEFWISARINELPRGLIMAVGGSFDIITGFYPRAPKIMRFLGLEWLWRLLLQPARIPRIWRAVVVFPLVLLKDILRKS